MRLFALCCSILLLASCNKSKKQHYEIASKPVLQKEQTHPGKKLMKVYCYVCHDATTPEDKRLAPPMIALKRRYMVEADSKKEFISEIQSFVQNPTEDNAKMYGAVKRFGVMSKMAYPEDVIEKIADYMYDNEIEQPEWFEEHYKERRNRIIKSD